MVVPVLRCCWFLLALWVLGGSAPLVFSQPVTQPFTFSIVPHVLPHVHHGALAWGDYDGDGDLDVFLSGVLDGAPLGALYRNDGTRHQDGPTVVFEQAQAFPALAYGDAAWGDYDGDGDLDLLMTGSRRLELPYDPVASLYRNDEGDFSAVTALFEGVHSGAVVWGDYDNDGDLDVLVGGARSDGTSVTHLYRNEGGAFADANVVLPGIAYGDAAWGDYDNDGDFDLLLAGVADDGIFTEVFRNDGSAFTPLQADLEPAAFASVDWGDYDDDGDLDVIYGGGQLSPTVLDGLTRLYRNDGSRFEAVAVTFPGALTGDTSWGDYDNDGDLDLLVMGAEDTYGRRLARLYQNDGGTYTEKVYVTGVLFGVADWGDLDGDGDLDLLASGLPTAGTPFVNLYENRRQVVTPPLAPNGLAAEVEAGVVTLRWQAAASSEGSTYNLRVGTWPGTGDVVAPMADADTGRRLLARPGNTQQNETWTLHDLAPGTYYWSVQALDPAFTGSPFAPEQQFTIGEGMPVDAEAREVPVQTVLHPASPNPFRHTATLRYDLQQPSTVVLRIYSVLGQRVATLVHREQEAGRHTAEWDGRDASGMPAGPGLYLCELQAGTYRKTITLLRLR